MKSQKYTQEKINEMLEQAHERSEDISRTLYEFNRMLQKTEKPREECYQFLFTKQMEIEKKYGIDCGFSFLYPEWIFKVEDTYEKHKAKMKEFSEQYKELKEFSEQYKDNAKAV